MLDDRYTFGPVLRLRPTGIFTVETWRDRWTDALAQAFWPKRVFTVCEVNPETGVITLDDRLG